MFELWTPYFQYWNAVFDYWMKTASLRFDHLDASHAASCAALHPQGFAHPWKAHEFESLISAANVVADGAFIDGELAGVCLSRYAAGEAEVLTLIVDEAHRRKGLAKALMQRQSAHLETLGVTEWFLEVETTNLAALMLYQNFKFNKVGERPAYYRHADGSLGHALIMRRSFD